MNLKNSSLLIILCFSLLSCHVNQRTVQYSNTSKKAPFEFIILQMNDVYEIAALEGGKAGGLARVATIRKKLLQENPNTISVLSGDFLSPSFLGTLNYENEEGKSETIAGLQMVETLNALGLDYVTFGNHEFDLKDPIILEKRMAQSNFKYTVCNALYNENGKLRPFNQGSTNSPDYVPTSIILKMTSPSGQRLSLGIIGVVLPFNKQKYVHYDDVTSSFKSVYEELRTKVDMCVGITHLSVEDDIKLAEDVPGIPLFLGGHDHSNMSRYVNNTIISKADANAKTIYIHRISVDLNSGFTNIRSNTLQIDDSIEEDPKTKAVVDKWLQKGFAIMEQMGYLPQRQVLKLSAPLICKESVIRNEQTNYGILTMNAIADIMPGADYYFINSGSMRLDDDLHNIVTEYDILRTFPYGGEMVRMKIPGKELAQVLQIGSVTNKGDGGYFQLKVNSDKSDNSSAGLPVLDLSKEYDIILPEFVAQGKEANLEILKEFKYTKEDVLMIGEESIKNDLRDIVIRYMLKIGEI